MYINHWNYIIKFPFASKTVTITVAQCGVGGVLGATDGDMFGYCVGVKVGGCRWY